MKALDNIINKTFIREKEIRLKFFSITKLYLVLNLI